MLPSLSSTPTRSARRATPMTIYYVTLISLTCVILVAYLCKEYRNGE
jgi:hypothetical protein